MAGIVLDLPSRIHALLGRDRPKPFPVLGSLLGGSPRLPVSFANLSPALPAVADPRYSHLGLPVLCNSDSHSWWSQSTCRGQTA